MRDPHREAVALQLTPYGSEATMRGRKYNPRHALRSCASPSNSMYRLMVRA